MRFVRLADALGAGQEGIGIYSGQLFHLLREIKDPNEIRTEEQLKRPLFTHIFGEGAWSIVEHSGRDYYCASMDSWTRALGTAPNPRDP